MYEEIKNSIRFRDESDRVIEIKDDTLATPFGEGINERIDVISVKAIVEGQVVKTYYKEGVDHPRNYVEYYGGIVNPEEFLTTINKVKGWNIGLLK